MSRDDTDITDERLTAYLDEALSADEAETVEAALEASAELRARLDGLQIPKDAIRAGFDDLLHVAPKMPVELRETPNRMRLAMWAPVAAALVVGLFLGSALLRAPEPDWVDVIANYQSLYVTETLTTAPIDKDAQIEILAKLSSDLGKNLSLLTGLEGIEFRRAQMLGINGAPLVQMAYLDGAVPIAICVTAITGGDNRTKYEQLFGMEAASWTENGFGYLVIGGDKKALIQRVAEQVRDKI